MTTINLYQNDEQRGLTKRSSNGGFFFSMGMLVLTLLVLGGLKVAASIIAANNLVLAAEIKKESDNIAGSSSLEHVIDTQNRLEEIKKNLAISKNAVNRVKMTTILDNLEKDLSAGVLVSEFNYTDGKVIVKINSNNFNDSARQILNFKNSEYFESVNLKSIARGEKAITADIEMGIKTPVVNEVTK